MNYLHWEFDGEPGDAIQVTLDKRANVRLMDTINFNKYRQGQRHKYYGGHATRTPITLGIPHQGHWHVVVDTGGYPGKVRAAANVIRG